MADDTVRIVGETGTQASVGYVIEIDGCGHRVYLDVEPSHGNRHGVLHGGFLTMLLDNAMGVGCSLTVSKDGKTPFMTIALNAHFHAPALIGERVVATGRVTGGGRKLLFCQGEIRSSDGALVASGSGIFKRVPTSFDGGRHEISGKE